jgi:hypothetical protein
LVVGSDLESLFDFSSVLAVVSNSAFVRAFYTMQEYLAAWLLTWFNFSSVHKMLFFDSFFKRIILMVCAALITTVFIIMTVSTFYYIRLVNSTFSGVVSSPVALNRQGLLNRVSLSMGILIFVLFFFNLFCVFFFSSVLAHVNLFFVKFSLGLGY